MDVEPEAATVEEAEDGDEDDDISIEELSALLPAGRIRKPVQRMNIAATNTKSYDGNTNVININIHNDVPRQLSEDEQVLHVLGVIMAQTYSIKNGIKEFGERGSESVMKELSGIDNLDTFFSGGSQFPHERTEASSLGIACVYHRKAKWRCQDQNLRRWEQATLGGGI